MRKTKKVNGLPPEPIYLKLGQRLQALRAVKGITQEEMAERVGLIRTSITNIEAGRQRILLHQLYLFAKVLKVNAFDLLREL